MSKALLLLARAFIGWGFAFQYAADWCIQRGYRNIDL